MVFHHHVRRVTDLAIEKKRAGHSFVTFTAALLIWVGFAPSPTPRASSIGLHGCGDSSTGRIELDREKGPVFT